MVGGGKRQGFSTLHPPPSTLHSQVVRQYGQGQTMVVIPGPVELVMGSPPTEAGRFGDEAQHKTRIDRTFVLSAKPVTVGEYRKFQPRYGMGEIERWARQPDAR